MKYIKTYESYQKFEFPTYKGKILINRPSQQYFRSSINYQIIFVDSVTSEQGGQQFSQSTTYTVQADNTIQINDDLSLTYTNWNQIYGTFDFENLDFMTPEEFYERHTESFIRLLEETIKESKNKLKTEWFKKKINEIIDRLTIAETEHIVNAEKYNV